MVANRSPCYTTATLTLQVLSGTNELLPLNIFRFVHWTIVPRSTKRRNNCPARLTVGMKLVKKIPTLFTNDRDRIGICSPLVKLVKKLPVWCASLSHHNFLTAAKLGWGDEVGVKFPLPPRQRHCS
jgi:hypothetical protein